MVGHNLHEIGMYLIIKITYLFVLILLLIIPTKSWMIRLLAGISISWRSFLCFRRNWWVRLSRRRIWRRKRKFRRVCWLLGRFWRKNWLSIFRIRKRISIYSVLRIRHPGWIWSILKPWRWRRSSSYPIRQYPNNSHSTKQTNIYGYKQHQNCTYSLQPINSSKSKSTHKTTANKN